MFSTQTRSWRVATLASESIPTKYLKLPMPCLYISAPPAKPLRHQLAAAAFHPPVGRLCIVDDLADRRIETEEAVGQAQSFHRVDQRTHAADQVRPASPGHDVERGGSAHREVLAQSIGDCTEGGEDVCIV